MLQLLLIEVHIYLGIKMYIFICTLRQVHINFCKLSLLFSLDIASNTYIICTLYPDYKHTHTQTIQALTIKSAIDVCRQHIYIYTYIYNQLSKNSAALVTFSGKFYDFW